MNILLLGPQGSGKGTQAKKISATYGVPHISSGDLYREAIARGTELGKQVEPILAAGELVPDEITIPLIRDRLSRGDTTPGFVLDGYPRNLAQADALDEMLEDVGRTIEIVFVFYVPDRQQLVLGGRVGTRVTRKRLLGKHVQADPPDARGGAREVRVDELLPEAHRLEDLRAAV